MIKITTYRKSILRADVDGFKSIVDQANEPVWGVWAGLFGLANNELIAITLVEPEISEPWTNQVQVLDEQLLVATERPSSSKSPSETGLYVFRSMETESKNIDEIVELSAYAWRTFETSDDYRSEPIGLFRPENPDTVSTMWLLTWYDGFESWQRSRNPHDDAKEAFMKRHALLRQTNAIATRLIA